MGKHPRRMGWACGLSLLAAVGCVGCSRFQSPPRPNILLITLDTTRADRIGAYGYERARTPVLDQLSREGVLFEKAFTPIPLTLPSHASMMTGFYPPEHGLRTNGSGSLPSDRTTLCEHLVKSGYDAGAFVASFVLDGKFGLNQGFHVYDDDLSDAQPTQDAIHRNRDGKYVVDHALDWLGKPRSKPFFCWVHLYDPHAPYDAHSDEFEQAFDDSPYDGEIAYTDRLAGRLLEFVRQHPQTIVIVAGDHGEGLGDHAEIQHGYTLYNSTLHVPLIVHGAAGIAAGSRVSAPVTLTDLFPTLLELAGIPVPAGISGRSLVDAVRGKPFAGRGCYGMTDDPFLQNGWSPLRSLTTDRWRYIRSAKPELYDLDADPRELNNLAASEPERLKELEAQLADLESALTIGEASSVQLSSAEQRALEGLGYAGGGNDAQIPETNHLPDVKDMLPFNVATQTAIDLIEAGKFDQAEVMLQKIVADSPPEHYSSRLYLGSVCERQGRFDEAETLYQAVLKLRPEDANALFHLGGLYADQGRFAEAIPIFERSREAEPDSAQPLYNLGLAYARLNQLDEAQRHFEEAIQVDPDFPGAWVALGNVLSRQGRTAEAVAAYESELAINSLSVEAHANLGVQFAGQDRFDEARKHLEEAVRIAPQNAEARFNLGVCLGKMGEHEAAVRELREAIRLRPESPGVRTALGNILIKLKRTDEALAELEEELRQTPGHLEALVNLGALLGQREQWDAAVERLEQAVKLSPENTEARFNLGLCYEKQGRLELAADAWEKVLRLNPNHARAATKLAQLRQRPAN